MRALIGRAACLAFVVAVVSACEAPVESGLELRVRLADGAVAPRALVVHLRDEGPPVAVATNTFDVAPEVFGEPESVLALGLDVSSATRGLLTVYVAACAQPVACSSGVDGLPVCPCLGPDAMPAEPSAVAAAQTRVRGRTVVSLTLKPFTPGCDVDRDGFVDAEAPICAALVAPTLAEAVLDCDDGEASAYPFRAVEPSPEDVVRDPALQRRNRLLCGNDIDEDCRGGAATCATGGDSDGDGFVDEEDCAPNDPDINPGRPEKCETTADDNCDGVFAASCDPDGDGVAVPEDCNEGDASVHRGAREVCGDGVDQDCDGRDSDCFENDEDLDGDGFACPGQLRWDSHRCAGAGLDCNDLDAGTYPGAEEICGDGLDQDCDGIDQPCVPGDVDGDGERRPEDGGSDCDDTNPRVRPGAAEKCGDGVDQDCSGADLPCAGLPDADGDDYPDGQDCNERLATVNAGAEELCNGIDDDCDGRADEGNPLRTVPGGNEAPPICGSDCANPAVACDCRRAPNACVRFAAAAGEAVAGVVCLGVTAGDNPEVAVTDCNGIDDDCDGTADEQLRLPCYEGGQGTEGVGVCIGGHRTCDSALGSNLTVWTETCFEQQIPRPESCDERRGDCCDLADQDCDGALDEASGGGPFMRPCFEFSPAIPGAGPCREGIETCSNGQFGACEGQVGPEVEDCDRIDDDCDGRPDVSRNGERPTRACYSGPRGTEGVGLCHGGRQTCSGGADLWGGCDGEIVPRGERCEGEDDDCDGRTDEDYDVRQPCSEGTGACRREGARVCRGDGGGTRCGVSAGAPSDELCGNGVDEDCNGRVDEGFDVGAECAVGDGICRRTGQRVCAADGRDTACGARPGAPGEELCDNDLDDDCDGRTDEGFAGLGEACNGGRGVCQRPGRRVCAADLRAVVCDAQPGAPGTEACNTTDDDCDGQTDEGFGVGDACMAGVGACQGSGRVVCLPNGMSACDAVAGMPVQEQCGNGDQDCDGVADADEAGLCPNANERCRMGACRAN